MSGAVTNGHFCPESLGGGAKGQAEARTTVWFDYFHSKDAA